MVHSQDKKWTPPTPPAKEIWWMNNFDVLIEHLHKFLKFDNDKIIKIKKLLNKFDLWLKVIK